MGQISDIGCKDRNTKCEEYNIIEDYIYNPRVIRMIIKKIQIFFGVQTINK